MKRGATGVIEAVGQRLVAPAITHRAIAIEPAFWGTVGRG